MRFGLRATAFAAPTHASCRGWAPKITTETDVNTGYAKRYLNDTGGVHCICNASRLGRRFADAPTNGPQT